MFQRTSISVFVIMFGILGLVAPGLWLHEYVRGRFFGHPDSILNILVYFFPVSLLFLAAPAATGWISILIFLTATALNIIVYVLTSLLFYLAIRNLFAMRVLPKQR